MTSPATRRADARLEGSELARFALGVVASALLVAMTTTALLAVVPSVLPGWRTTAVSSGSMAPAFHVGDAVVIKNIEPGDGLLGPPSVVLVERRDREPLLHRVVDTDGRTYRTRGDANPQPDTDRVEPDRVVGVGRLVVPYGGWVSLWWGRGEYLSLALFAAAVALLLHWARYGWLDAYDPWKIAAARAAGDMSHGDDEGDGDDVGDEQGGSPEVAETSPREWGPADAAAHVTAAGRRPATSTLRDWMLRSVRSARLHGVVGAVSVALVVGAGAATATASAFSGVATMPSTMAAGSLAPASSLRAVCSEPPHVIDSVTAGPGQPAPAYPPTTRVGDILLLSRAGTRVSTNGSYPAVVAPSGWTGLITNLDDVNGRFHALYAKTADSATGTVPHATGDADLLVVLRGGTVVTSSVGAGRAEPGSSVTAPSVAAPSPGLVVAMWAAIRGNVAFSTPDGLGTVAEAPTYTNTISVGGHRREVTSAGVTGSSTTNLTDATSAAEVSAWASGLSVFVGSGTPATTLSWTPSATPAVDGYTVLRNGTQVATLPASATTWTDPASAPATTTYSVVARLKNWMSLPVNTTPASGGC